MKKKILLFLAGFIMAALLAGCATPKLISLAKVEKGIRQDFKEMGSCSFSGLLSDIPKVVAEARGHIRENQCFFNMANPPIISSTKELALVMEAGITAEGQIGVSVVPNPSLGASLGLSSSSSQKIPWTIMPVSLGSLPDFYLQSQLTALNGAKDLFAFMGKESGKKEAKDRLEKLIGKYFENAKKLKFEVEYLMDTYENFDCRTVDSGGPVIMKSVN